MKKNLYMLFYINLLQLVLFWAGMKTFCCRIFFVKCVFSLSQFVVHDMV